MVPSVLISEFTWFSRWNPDGQVPCAFSLMARELGERYFRKGVKLLGMQLLLASTP